MKLLQDIKEAAMNDNQSVTSLLTKCKVLASDLDNKKLFNWADKELNGYEDVDTCPAYRKIETQSWGTLISGLTMTNNAPIPPAALPDKLQEFAVTDYLLKGVSYYEQLINDPEIQKKGLRIPWHPDAIAYANQHFQKTGNPLIADASKAMTLATIAELLQVLRSMVLDFVLEIEKELPSVTEVSFKKDAVSKEQVNQIVQNNIEGDMVVIQQAQTVNIQSVRRRDFCSLKEVLQLLGIDEPDILELQQAIQEDGIQDDQSSIGSKTLQWIKKHAVTATGSLAASTGTIGGGKIIEALFRFFGI